MASLEKQSYQSYSVVSLTHTGSHRDPDKCLNEICLLSFSDPKPGSEGLRIGFSLHHPLSRTWTRLTVSFSSLSCPTLHHSASLAALSLQTPGLQCHPKGVCGRDGGAWSISNVGGGCASRGAWAGGGRGHEETRGQRWQPRLQNNRTREWGRGATHPEGIRSTSKEGRLVEPSTPAKGTGRKGVLPTITTILGV